MRNKLFFFADYEGIRKHSAQTLQQTSVLTPDMLAGNFSALTAQGIRLVDSQNNFTPYQNNQVPVVNPVAQFLAAHPDLYPAPNRSPQDGLIENNYVGPQAGFVRNNQWDFKVDFAPRNPDRINGFYAQGTGNDFTSAILPISFPANNTYPTKIAGASYVHTFSPAIVNEARFGFTRVRWNNGVPSDPSGLFGFTGDQKVGIPFGTQKFVGFTSQSISNNASSIGTQANPWSSPTTASKDIPSISASPRVHPSHLPSTASRQSRQVVQAGHHLRWPTHSANNLVLTRITTFTRCGRRMCNPRTSTSSRS